MKIATWLALGLSFMGLAAGTSDAAELTLTWAASDDAERYLVEREDDPGIFAEIGSTPVDVLVFVDSGVAGGRTYCYRIRASNAAGFSEYSNVACGGTGATGGTFADDFTRPDAPALGNGWSTVSGTLAIEGGQARNARSRALHAAVQTSLSGATQDAAASFAAVDANLVQRYGILVRYRDSGNHYMCSRQTGGTSLLKISRIVSGVETVLKSVAIPNPVRERFFTITCHVQGNMLALSLDGVVKVTAVDSVIDSGAVGMFIGISTTGSGTPGSHRADKFIAVVQ